MSTPDPIAVDLHDLLRRLAGGVPDEVLAGARDDVADGRFGEVVRRLAATGVPLPLTESDHDFLVALGGTAEGGGPVTIDRTDPDTGVRWRFAEAPGDDHEPGPATPGEALADALADEPAARGLWRAWRTPAGDEPPSPACPVYVVEVDDPTAVPALTGRLQRLLRAAGEDVPRVEVVAVRGEVPAYQRAAWARGRLLWAAAQTREIAVARVFDAVDPVTGPSFAPDHPLITDPDERDRILGYLRQGTALLVTMGVLDDVVDPARGAVVPMNYRTDGTWIWTDTVTYYLQTHRLAPDPELLDHIRAADGPPEPLDAVSLHRAITALTTAAAGEPVWSAPGS